MLTPETALRKDRNATPAAMQHRHFATIAAMIVDLPLTEANKQTVAKHFASELYATNDRFDEERFLRACGF